jgi:hypothetical protein
LHLPAAQGSVLASPKIDRERGEEHTCIYRPLRGAYLHLPLPAGEEHMCIHRPLS